MKHTISILVENHAGVLSRVTGLFSRRGFNIDSLAVGVTSDPEISRITIIVEEDSYIVEQVEKQLNKLIDVIKVRSLASDTVLHRELVLLKLCKSLLSSEQLDLLKEKSGGKLHDCGEVMVAELCENWQAIEETVSLLPKTAIVELVRTGVIAITADEKTLNAD